MENRDPMAKIRLNSDYRPYGSRYTPLFNSDRAKLIGATGKAALLRIDNINQTYGKLIGPFDKLDAPHHIEKNMQNENNDSPVIADLNDAHSVGTYVVAATSNEPKSRLVGFGADGVPLVTDDTDLGCNVPVRVVDPELKRGVTVKTGPVDPVPAHRHSAKVHVGHVGHTRRSGPARGPAIGAALAVALSAVNKTVQDFPKAPEKKGGKKHKDRSFPKTTHGAQGKPQHNFKGSGNRGPQHSRGGNRGK